MATNTLQELALAKGETFVWHELDVPNAKAAVDFYTEAFDFASEDIDMGPMGAPGQTYHLLKRNGQAVAGIMGTDAPGMQGMTTRWATFLGVDDVDASVERCLKLGGKVAVPAMDIPQIGRMAQIEDNQGANFWIFKPAPQM